MVSTYEHQSDLAYFHVNFISVGLEVLASVRVTRYMARLFFNMLTVAQVYLSHMYQNNQHSGNGLPHLGFPDSSEKVFLPNCFARYLEIARL